MYFAEATQPMAVVGIILGSVLATGALAAGIGYMWSKFNSGKGQVADESSRLDKVLKDLVETQDKRYKTLEDDHKNNLKELGILQGKLEEQARQSKWFESIMIEALEGFFGKNPDLAFELSKKIGKRKS